MQNVDAVVVVKTRPVAGLGRPAAGIAGNAGTGHARRPDRTGGRSHGSNQPNLLHPVDNMVHTVAVADDLTAAGAGAAGVGGGGVDPDHHRHLPRPRRGKDPLASRIVSRAWAVPRGGRYRSRNQIGRIWRQRWRHRSAAGSCACFPLHGARLGG